MRTMSVNKFSEHKINTDIFFDEIGPEKIIVFNESAVDMKGYLVIDNSAFGVPSGGIRMAYGTSINEVIKLARAMTLKFCTYQMPVGGAKAGIDGDPLDKNRSLLITSFAKAIGPLIRENQYYPGPDMGTYDSDIEKVFKIAGTPEKIPPRLGLKRKDIPIEELFTGYGVVYSIETIYSNRKKYFTDITRDIDKKEKPKIILEGFGKVGTGVAMRLNELGFNLVGLSTIEGAVFDEDGLEINKLLELKKIYGDELVNQYESKNSIKVVKEKLFGLSSEYQIDFMIPGARPNSINRSNIDKINVKAIVPAANIPYAPGIIDILQDKKIIAIPDFVSNAGEVLALAVLIAIKEPSEIEIFNSIQDQIQKKTIDVLNGAQEENIAPYEFAKNRALKTLLKKIKRRRKQLERLSQKFNDN